MERMRVLTISNFIDRLPVFRGRANLRVELEKSQERVRQLQQQKAHGRANPENMIWILGTGRSGSTWLGRMMGEVTGYALWNEPQVGSLFGRFYYEQGEHLHGRKHFALGGEQETWMPSVRRFILDLAAAKLPGIAREAGKYIVVKEPNGSIGAPLIMQALPESKMIFLIRDPRDAVASKLDGRRPGGWNRKWNKSEKRPQMSEDKMVQSLARGYMKDISRTSEAYAAHGGDKVTIRYEDLRDDTLGTMKKIYSALNLPLDGEELTEIVVKHSWENIPEEDKGPGKLRRKATPGGWEEDLTPGQIETVEQTTAPILEKFYPESVS